MNKKQIEKKYDCDIFTNTGFDSKRAYWVAFGRGENPDFEYADGWTLTELVENIARKRAESIKT